MGSKIRKLRERAGLTQGQLAEKVGVDRTMIVKIENGLDPSIWLLKAIAAVLDFPAGELIND